MKTMKPHTNLWKCPACGKVVDYGKGTPSKGKTQCDSTGEEVQMVKLDERRVR